MRANEGLADERQEMDARLLLLLLPTERSIVLSERVAAVASICSSFATSAAEVAAIAAHGHDFEVTDRELSRPVTTTTTTTTAIY